MLKNAPAVGHRSGRDTPGLDAVDTQARVQQIVSRRPVVGLALGVVRAGRLQTFHGHGVADIASGALITEDTVFRIASITKTFTAVAMMQLWEQGLVDLDAPARDYLRAYRLIPARSGHRPATLRHLLTHTAGLGELAHPSGIFRPDFGESVPAGKRLPSLAEFYGGAIRLGAEPGTRFVYGNHGPATLGQIVEDVSGLPLERYFRERIFEPLGMTDSDLLRTETVASRLATGYEIGSRGPQAVAERDMVTAGAASIYSTPRDMALYAAGLLGGGKNEHGSVLQPATVATLFEPHYQPDPRVPGMGLGFFRADLGGHPIVEHQGVHPGFHSQLSLAPDDGIGVIALTNGAWQPMYWLGAEVHALLRDLVGAQGDEVGHHIPQHAETWPEVCGWYRLDAALTDVRLRAMLGAGIEVFVRDGQLTLRFLTLIPELYRGFRLRPDDPSDLYRYRIDLGDMGTSRVVFGERHGNTAGAIHLELMPLSLPRQSAATNPRRLATGLIGGLVLAGGVVAIRRQLG